MLQHHHDTAVLLFSRTSAAEARVKSFLPAKARKQNKKIASALINRSTQLLKRCSLPCFVSDETIQLGNTFGEKLSSAIEQVFQSGYSKIIVLGNDCPQLTIDLVTEAAIALRSHQQVLIPTSKGGVALIGLTKECFNQEVFASIPWQTNQVAGCLMSAKEATLILPVLDDINEYADLLKQSHLLKKVDALYCYFISIIASVLHLIKKHKDTFSLQVCQHQLVLRGPPLYSSL